MDAEKSEESKGKENRNSQKLILIVALVAIGIGMAWASQDPDCCDVDEPAAPADNSTDTQPPEQAESKVELYHFHGDSQCYSCVRLGELAEKTANTYFEDELESGRLVFDHINYDLPENKEVTERFGATGSSLWIGTTVGDEFSKEENTRVWYKIDDEDGYLDYLKGIIEKRLAGNLN